MNLTCRALIIVSLCLAAIPRQGFAHFNFLQRAQIAATAPRCQSLRADAPGWSTHLTSFHKLDGPVGAIADASTTPATATGFNAGSSATFVNPGASLTYADGRFGQSVLFNGTTGDYIDMGDTSNIQDLANAPGSVMLWFTQTQLHKGSLIYKSDDNSNAGWMAFVYPGVDDLADEFYFEFWSVYSTTTLKVKSAYLPFAQQPTWNQLIITWNGTTDASEVRFYLNGALLTNHYSRNGVGTKGSDAGYLMKVGAADGGMDSLTGGPPGSFQGKIDEIAFWRKQLSPQEVRSLYFTQACKP